MPRPRGSFLIALGVGFLAVTASVYPKESLDLKSIVQSLRQTVKDLDERLRRLEGTRTVATPTRPGTTDPAAAQAAYLTGRTQEERKEYRNAVESYTKAVSLDPANDSALLHRAYSYCELGQLEDALADVNQSIKVQPNNSRAYAFRAKVYREKKDYQRAIPDLEEALARDPQNPDFLVSMASIQEEEGQFSRAADAYNKALEIKFDAPAVHVKRALALQKMDQLDDALRECSLAVKLDQANAEAYACRAGILVHKGQLPEAIIDLNQAIRIDPTLPSASGLVLTLKQLVDLNETAKKLAEQRTSKPVAESARAVPPSPAQPSSAPSSSVASSSAPPSSVPPSSVPPSSVPSISAPPTSPPPAAAVPARVVPAGVVPTNVHPPVPAPGPSGVAAVALTPFHELSLPQTPPVLTAQQIREVDGLTMKAREFAEKNQLASAIDLLNQVLLIDPSSPLAYNSRGYVYLRMRQCEPAIRDFSTAIQLKPNYANAYWNRGVIERLCGNEVAGKEDMKKASQPGWTNPVSASVATAH